jgi:hypothetical protein
MLVLEKLRDNYSSADFIAQFLKAAIQKADIDALMSADMRVHGIIDILSLSNLHNIVSAHTPPAMSMNNIYAHLNIDLTANMDDFDMNDFLNCDEGNDMWIVPLGEGVGFVGG